MATIKEKSEEHLKSVYAGYDNVLKELVKEGYEAGANYVLEQIENLTDNQNWCAFPKQSHKELKELIEQLKK